ncbi:MAG: nitrite reductase large subunit NirB [Actinomycetota bacterium]|nr:nitrite reductase large subunit NirB [Actinomycetota bacterium]
MEHPLRIVVIGNGMVGHRFVELLAERDLATRCQVEVFGAESRPAYDRVALSSYFDGFDAEKLSLLPDRGYPGVVLHVGDPVVELDRGSRTVTSASGLTTSYDVAVLATGSRPFVPPVPGATAPGCHVYRTVEDLERIRDWSARATHGVVVGGGLLGLEAAGALGALGVETHVVEMAPRLLPLQVDEGGGAVLRRRIEALGIDVRTDCRIEEVLADDHGHARGVRLAGGETLTAEIVIFAAGVRPEDSLARSSGLAVGVRGGVEVGGDCRTADPYVYAIGECACVDGTVFGLVAPGYQMAEVVADQIEAVVSGGAVEDAARFPEPDTSTKLKLLGVDVASFGDAFGTSDGALELVYADHVSSVYRKLVVSDDGRRLLGGVLVGDTAAYPLLRSLAASGSLLAEDPERLLFPASGAGGGQSAGVAALPGEAIVCSCRNVSKSTIVAAVCEGGCEDVGSVKACTGAGTGCGSCLPMVKELVSLELAKAGKEVSRALCEHFDMSRQELFELVRVQGWDTFTEVVSAAGRGRGCDVCKPVVASVLASQPGHHPLDGEAAALQDTNDHFLANIQKDGTYSVVPRVPGGEISPDGLIAIASVAREFGLYTKITGAQRIDMFGARAEQLPAIWSKLVAAGFESGHAYGKALRTVKSCVGSTWCRYGVQDSVALAIQLELRYRGLRSPHKIKAGVSGCARECAEARGKDFGIIATEAGWNLYVGGNGGFRPRHADLLASDLTTDELIRYVDRFLMFYVRAADKLQRTAAWLESMEGGLDHLRSVIVEDSLGICAELDRQMAEHVASYSDEWKAVLDDPAKLARFSSFVNAPGVADPDIVFVSERGQIRPAGTHERTLTPASSASN